MTTLTAAARSSQSLRSYGGVVSGVLVVAFALSMVHTTYSWATGLDDPAFTVTTPLAWAFYAVGFAVAGLARRERPAMAWAVAAYLVVLLGIAILYYPTVFTLPKQTLFGWVENDVYTGLLVTAFVLQVLRLRDVTLVTRL